MSAPNAPIILATGGTGGHIFPAEALAENLLARGERVALITDRRFDNFQHGVFSQIETHTIRSASPGGGLLRKIIAAGEIALGIAQAYRILKRLRPSAVVGFGGYPSFPTLIAASRMGIPTIIHEQNAVLGRANRWLAPKVDRIATSFTTTLMIAPQDELKVTFTGNPVRGAVRALHEVPYPALSHEGKMQILVTGGSQGASIFSQILPAAMAALPPVLRSRIRLDQQCREADMPVAKAAYEQLGMSVDLSSFFTDIPARLASAHLVIARSGASTVAELAAAGRPGILVPYPRAMDNHQYFNANAFEDAGGGWVMPQEGFTAAALAARLEAFLGLPATLAKAAEQSRAMGRPDAAERLAALVFSLRDTAGDTSILEKAA